MPHLNVEISEEAMVAAKLGSAAARIPLRKWIEDFLLATIGKQPTTIKLREPATPETKPDDPDAYRRLPSGRLLSPADAALRRASKLGRQS